jgi:hypothetical protein
LRSVYSVSLGVTFCVVNSFGLHEHAKSLQYAVNPLEW